MKNIFNKRESGEDSFSFIRSHAVVQVLQSFVLNVPEFVNLPGIATARPQDRKTA